MDLRTLFVQLKNKITFTVLGIVDTIFDAFADSS